MMTFSVVIPTYNGADFVAQAIESALKQSRPADEIIVSDDNSTDDTKKICMAYKDKIKFFSNPNGPSGFVNGWNNAIAHATSDYISILHQDDLLYSSFLEEAEKALLTYPYVKHLFAVCTYIDEDNKITGKSYDAEDGVKLYTGKEYLETFRDTGNPHIHRCPGVITHKDILNMCKYREEAGHIADNDFFFRVGQYTDVVGILHPLASYRHHNKSETGHLRNKELVIRLLKDYDFQLKHFNENVLADRQMHAYFKKNKNEYIKHLIGYSIKTKCFSDFLLALKYLF